jgi:hypothetical protein
MLWNRSLVMRDVETGSLWSHIRGEAMQGELTGSKLTPLSTELVTWAAWRTEHPATTVLNMTRASRFVDQLGLDHSKSFYKDATQFVYGWTVGFQRYHTLLAALQKQPVMNLTLPRANLLLTFDPDSTDINLFSRRVGSQDLTFAAAGTGRIRDEQTGTTWNARTGEALEGRLKGQRLQTHLGMISYTNAWESFYPSSTRVPSP